MNRSESIANLAKAMAAFNSEVARISKDAENPFLKNNYASLDQIIDEVRPILTKNGLTLMQFPGGDGTNITIKTFIMHESGEYIESEPLNMRPVKSDPQAIGSCITYGRRYSLAAFLSLNTGADDDGNEAAGKTNQSKQQTPPGGQPSGVNNNQLNLLNTLITRTVKEKNIEREQVLQSLRNLKSVGHFNSLKELTTAQAKKAIEALQKSLGNAS